VTAHIDTGPALAAAEHLAVQVLEQLSPGCAYTRALAGSTKRGPAFLYACSQCGALSVISVPAGGLRNRDPGDPTSRTRIATFALASVIVETGAYIESDGTVRSIFSLHLPGKEEPEWEITTDRAEAVGACVQALRCLPGHACPIAPAHTGSGEAVERVPEPVAGA
jgi:hypothetical protein